MFVFRLLSHPGTQREPKARASNALDLLTESIKRADIRGVSLAVQVAQHLSELYD